MCTKTFLHSLLVMVVLVAAARGQTTEEPSLVDLAAKKFGELSKPAQKLFERTAQGRLADYSNDVEQDRVLEAAWIEWLCTDRMAQQSVTHRGIQLGGARINGTLDLAFSTIPFSVVFFVCTLEDLDVRHAEIRELHLISTQAKRIEGDALHVIGDLLLTHGFKAEGEVRFPGATIGGEFDCQNSEFSDRADVALMADGMQVMGNVNLNNGFKSEGEVRFLGARIGMNLDCGGAQFSNSKRPAFNADGMEIAGSAILNNGFKSEGEVRFLGARIRRNLDCAGGHFSNRDGFALNVDGMQVTDSVYLNNGFEAEGEVRLLGATVNGSLECTDGHFHNPKEFALNTDRMQVAGSVFLNHGFTAEGKMRCIGATIEGNLDCTRGWFSNPMGDALNAESVQIRGNVFLNDGFKADGVVDLTEAAVDGSLVWKNIETTATVYLLLESANIGVLWDEEASWPPDGQLILDGLVYDRIYRQSPTSSNLRIAWLHRQGRVFQPQPYEQ